MKLIRLIFLSLLALAVLQGCNTARKDKNEVENKTEEVKDKTENAVENRDHDEDEDVDHEEERVKSVDIKTEKFPFNFTKFDLKARYKDNKEYEAEFKKETDYIKAEIEDDVNNKRVKGDDAYVDLKPILDKLTFDKSTSDEDVIKQVLKEFNLKSDYQQFKLKVRFDDGTVKEYIK